MYLDKKIKEICKGCPKFLFMFKLVEMNFKMKQRPTLNIGLYDSNVYHCFNQFLKRGYIFRAKNVDIIVYDLKHFHFMLY